MHTVLHDILEEFSRGKYIETHKFAEFLLEYNNRPENVCHDQENQDHPPQPAKKKESEEEKQKNAEEQLEILMQKLKSKNNLFLYKSFSLLENLLF